MAKAEPIELNAVDHGHHSQDREDGILIRLFEAKG